MPSFAAFLPSARTRQGGLSCDGYTIRRRFGRISRLSIEKSSFERYSGRYTAQNLPPFFKRCAAAATKPSIPAVVSWNAANLPGSAFLKPQLFFRYGGFVKTQSKLPCVVTDLISSTSAQMQSKRLASPFLAAFFRDSTADESENSIPVTREPGKSLSRRNEIIPLPDPSSAAFTNGLTKSARRSASAETYSA